MAVLPFTYRITEEDGTQHLLKARDHSHAIIKTLKLREKHAYFKVRCMEVQGGFAQNQSWSKSNWTECAKIGF